MLRLLPFRVLSRCLDPACLPLPQSRSSDPCAHHLTHLPTLPPHLHTVSLLGNTLLYDDTTTSSRFEKFLRDTARSYTCLELQRVAFTPLQQTGRLRLHLSYLGDYSLLLLRPSQHLHLQTLSLPNIRPPWSTVRAIHEIQCAVKCTSCHIFVRHHLLRRGTSYLLTHVQLHDDDCSIREDVAAQLRLLHPAVSSTRSQRRRLPRFIAFLSCPSTTRRLQLVHILQQAECIFHSQSI